jgi:hypothetical protein
VVSADGESAKVKIIVAVITTIGVLGAAVVAGLFLLASQPDAAGSTQNQSSTQPPTNGNSTLTSPPTSSVSNSSSTASQRDEDRIYFEVPVGEFKFSAYMVWRGDGSVASTGAVDLGNVDDSAKCRVRADFVPMGTKGAPVGNTKPVGCPKDRPAKYWPSFGPVELDNDAKIDFVNVIIYFNDEPAVTFTCPRRADCERIS